MQTAYNILIVIAVIVAFLFALLIFVTGKGDAMGGGGGVRTTFKGKAGFDDYMSKATLILGVCFMAFMLILDAMSAHLNKGH